MKILLSFSILLLSLNIYSQSVGIGTDTPNASAKLDVSSTTKGVTLPSMSSQQRKAISNPAKGLLVFDIDKACFYFYNGNEWRAINHSNSTNVNPVFNDIANTSDATVASSIAMGNGYTALGFRGKDTLGFTNIGSVYMLKKDANEQWQLTQIILPSDIANTSANFGSAIAIDSNYMVISAPGKTEGILAGAGRVYVYKFNGTSWILETSFVNPLGSQANEGYGYAVDISHIGTTIQVAVGSPKYKNGSFTSAGMYSLHKRNPVNGIWSTQLTSTGNASFQLFGTAVAISGNHSVVSAIGYDTTLATVNYDDLGVVHSYKYNGTTWAYNNRYVGNIDTSNYFGYRIALNDSVLIVSGGNVDINNNSSENLFIRKLDAAGNFNNVSFVSPNNLFNESANPGCIGIELAINNNYLLVGLPMTHVDPLFSCFFTGAGSVLVYKINANGSITFLNKIYNSENISGFTDRFGNAVAIDESVDYSIATYQTSTNQNSNKGVAFGTLED